MRRYIIKNDRKANAQRGQYFTHDSAETFGFLASPSARSYNKRVSGSLRCTRSAHICSAIAPQTSDTRQPLCENCAPKEKMKCDLD